MRQRSGLAVLALLGLLIGMAACDSLSKPQNSPSLTGPTSTAFSPIVVQGTIEMPLTPDEFSQLPDEVLQAATKTGWERTSTGLQRTSALPGVDVVVGTTTLTSDDNGQVMVPALLVSQVSTMRIKADREVAVTDGVSVKGVRTLRAATVFKKYNHSDMTSMTMPNGAKHVMAMDDPGRCLDYNGFLSSSTGEGNGNYGVTQNPIMAVRNYVGSDCDLANQWILHCVREYIPTWAGGAGAGCQKLHGSLCSTFIGHPSVWHRHSLM